MKGYLNILNLLFDSGCDSQFLTAEGASETHGKLEIAHACLSINIT
jgi:hypothetical protein